MTADRVTWPRGALGGHVGAARSNTPPSFPGTEGRRGPDLGTKVVQGGVSGCICFFAFSLALVCVAQSLVRSRFTLFMQTILALP